MTIWLYMTFGLPKPLPKFKNNVILMREDSSVWFLELSEFPVLMVMKLVVTVFTVFNVRLAGYLIIIYIISVPLCN